MIKYKVRYMKFNFFENLGSFFNSKNQDNKFFSEKFEKFFELNDYLFCLDLIEQGYESSKSQNKKLYKKINEKIENKDYHFKEIKKYLFIPIKLRIKSIIMSDFNYSERDNVNKEFRLLLKEDNGESFKSLAIESLDDFLSFYVNGMDSFNDFCSYDRSEFEKKQKQLNQILMYTLNISKTIVENYEINNVLDIAKKLEKTLKKIESKTGTSYKDRSFSRISYYSLENYQKEMVKSITESNSNENEKKEILRRLESSKIIDKKFEIKQEFSIQDLPHKIQNKISEIENLLDTLEDEDKLLFNEKITNIVKKYLSIDVDYRTTLKNIEGYNAEQLMEQSLDNLEVIFEKKIIDNNQNSLTELSIENRKLKIK